MGVSLGGAWGAFACGALFAWQRAWGHEAPLFYFIAGHHVPWSAAGRSTATINWPALPRQVTESLPPAASGTDNKVPRYCDSHPASAPPKTTDQMKKLLSERGRRGGTLRQAKRLDALDQYPIIKKASPFLHHKKNSML